MSYKTEQYKNCIRFNEQYPEIYRFLLQAGTMEHNAHFHWGRFAWMQGHSLLDADRLTAITLFKDARGEMVGMLTYDTFYDDRAYLIHTTSDPGLLNRMIDVVLEMEAGPATIKVNSKDEALIGLLRKRQFEQRRKDVSVLALDLGSALEYAVPAGYAISPEEFELDRWQYQLVIHRGFDNEGLPAPWRDEDFAYGANMSLKAFAIAEGGYCAHCAVWYTEGTKAYIEPVVTLPEHRRRGLARAVVYAACKRAHMLGARQAIVLSDQEFYYRIGFQCASEVYCWEKNA